jgi:hypothetical protein
MLKKLLLLVVKTEKESKYVVVYTLLAVKARVLIENC